MTYRVVFTSPSGSSSRYYIDAPNKAAAINRARSMVPKNPVYILESVEMIS